MHHSPTNVNMMAAGKAGLAKILERLSKGLAVGIAPLAFAQAAASIPHDALPCAAALAAARSHVLK